MRPSKTRKIPKREAGRKAVRPRDEEGMLTFMEVAMGAAIVSLLVLVAITVFRVTETGTLKQKRLIQAQNLAKEKVEELKSYINSTNWESVRVDTRFPPATPAPSPYMNYPPTTIRVENANFIVDTEVRYVQEDTATGRILPVPTPGTVETPEYGDLIRLRTDVYYGPPAEYVPVPTLEAGNPDFKRVNRVITENLVTRKTAQAQGKGIVNGRVLLGSCAGIPAPGVEVAAYRGSQKIAFTQTSSSGWYEFMEIPEGDPVSLVIASSQAYTFTAYCSANHPVTVDAMHPTGINILAGVVPVALVRGFTFYATPCWTPPPGPPPVLTAVVPANNVKVFIDDGISKPGYTGAGNFFAIPNVRTTPVPDPNAWYTVSGENNLFSGTALYPQDGLPVTLMLYDSIHSQSVTVRYFDIYANNILSPFYPMKVVVEDGGTPQTLTLTPGNEFYVNTRIGEVKFNFSYADGGVPGYLPHTASATVTVGMTAPITFFTAQPVGTGAGTIIGLGNYEYERFRLVAEHVYDIVDIPNIPVSHMAGATYGTFRYPSFPATLTGSWDYTLRLDTDQGSDFATDQPLIHITHDQAVTLGSMMYVRRKNAYWQVFVNKAGKPFASGALVQAMEGASVTIPSELGFGSAAQRYFSSATSGAGSALFPVQLYASPITYTTRVSLVDPNTLQASVTQFNVVTNDTHSYEAPLTINVNFP